jgi:hypothetical protein
VCAVCGRVYVKYGCTYVYTRRYVCAHGSLRAKRKGDALRGRSSRKKVGVMA